VTVSFTLNPKYRKKTVEVATPMLGEKSVKPAEKLASKARSASVQQWVADALSLIREQK